MAEVVRAIKVPLYVTEEQINILNDMADNCHRIGNSAVEVIKDGHIDSSELRKILTNKYGSSVLSLSFVITAVVRDKIDSYFKHGGRINFHKYKESRKSFPVRCDESGSRLSRIYTDDLQNIKIPSINGKVCISKNWINKYRRKYGDDYVYSILNSKKQTARVVFDGKYWYLIFTLFLTYPESEKQDRALGVDLGIKKLVVTSDGEEFYGVNNMSDEVVRLEGKIKKLQVICSRKYRHNNFSKSKSIESIEHKIHMYQRRLKSIRENELHHISKFIIDKNYKAVFLENLGIRGMMKNKRLAKAIGRQCWYKLRMFIEYKGENRGVIVKIVERTFASSKICSKCGNVKHNLLLSDRVYNCTKCGFVIDRDLNAAINIRNRGLLLI